MVDYSITAAYHFAITPYSAARKRKFVNQLTALINRTAHSTKQRCHYAADDLPEQTEAEMGCTCIN